MQEKRPPVLRDISGFDQPGALDLPDRLGVVVRSPSVHDFLRLKDARTPLRFHDDGVQLTKRRWMVLLQMRPDGRCRDDLANVQSHFQ